MPSALPTFGRRRSASTRITRLPASASEAARVGARVDTKRGVCSGAEGLELAQLGPERIGLGARRLLDQGNLGLQRLDAGIDLVVELRRAVLDHGVPEHVCQVLRGAAGRARGR